MANPKGRSTRKTVAQLRAELERRRRKKAAERARAQNPPKKSRGRSRRQLDRVQPRMRSMGPMSLSRFFDPASTPHYASHYHKATPYTVLRERLILNVPTDSAGATIVMFGPNTAVSTAQNTTCVGAHGVGTALTSTWSPVVSNLLPFATYGGKVRIRLHRLSVHISCVGTGSGTVPPGSIWAGTLDAPIDLTAFTDFTAVSNFLLGRNQLHAVSAFASQHKPLVLASHPLDPLSWAQFENNGTNNTTYRTADTMAPIAVVIPAITSSTGSSAINWTLSVHAEWAVMFANDAVLQATHRIHPVCPEISLASATSALQNVGGWIDTAVQGGQAVLSVANAVAPLLGRVMG